MQKKEDAHGNKKQMDQQLNKSMRVIKYNINQWINQLVKEGKESFKNKRESEGRIRRLGVTGNEREKEAG